jgi:hypothetical protein
LFKKISDYRILNEAALKVKATKHFGLSLNWQYLHDRFPAALRGTLLIPLEVV